MTFCNPYLCATHALFFSEFNTILFTAHVRTPSFISFHFIHTRFNINISWSLHPSFSTENVWSRRAGKKRKTVKMKENNKIGRRKESKRMFWLTPAFFPVLLFLKLRISVRRALSTLPFPFLFRVKEEYGRADGYYYYYFSSFPDFRRTMFWLALRTLPSSIYLLDYCHTST